MKQVSELLPGVHFPKKVVKKPSFLVDGMELYDFAAF